MTVCRTLRLSAKLHARIVEAKRQMGLRTESAVIEMAVAEWIETRAARLGLAFVEPPEAFPTHTHRRRKKP